MQRKLQMNLSHSDFTGGYGISPYRLLGLLDSFAQRRHYHRSAYSLAQRFFLNNNAKPTLCQAAWQNFLKNIFYRICFFSKSDIAEKTLNAKNFAPLELKCNISSEYKEVLP